jgi:hypothetical protein
MLLSLSTCAATVWETVENIFSFGMATRGTDPALDLDLGNKHRLPAVTDSLLPGKALQSQPYFQTYTSPLWSRERWVFTCGHVDCILYAVLVGGSNGDGARRGLVTIVELIDPRPYIFSVCRVRQTDLHCIYMSDRLLTEANPDPRLPPPPELRSFAHSEV